MVDHGKPNRWIDGGKGKAKIQQMHQGKSRAKYGNTAEIGGRAAVIGRRFLAIPRPSPAASLVPFTGILCGGRATVSKGKHGRL